MADLVSNQSDPDRRVFFFGAADDAALIVEKSPRPP